MKQPFDDFTGTVLVPDGSVEYEDGYLVKEESAIMCFGNYAWFCDECPYGLKYECKIASKENER